MSRRRDGAAYLARAENWKGLDQNPADIAREEGADRKTVANAIRVAKNLHEGLKERLRRGELATSKAVALARKTRAEQEAHLDHVSSASGSLVMQPTQLRELEEAIRGSTKPAAWKSGALAVLSCVLDQGTISGIWPLAESKRR